METDLLQIEISTKKTLKKIQIALLCLIIIVMSLCSSLFAQGNIKMAGIQSLSMFRLQMAGSPNYLDEVVIYYQEGATNGFDSEFDAYKIFGPNPAPHISIDNDSLQMSINGIPKVTQSYTTHILATTPVNKTFTISATDIQGLPRGTCVFLTDLFIGTTTNLLTNSYSFSLSATSINSRFLLAITFNSLPVTSVLSQPNCHITNSGKFYVMGDTLAPWNYVWKDSLDNPIKSAFGSYDGDSLIGLSSGHYTLEMTSVSNACYGREISFTIDSVIPPKVAFSSPDTITASVFTNFTTTNLSSNCEVYNWKLNGADFSIDEEASTTFQMPGVFNVMLVGTSSTGCMDSIAKLITVIDLTTSVSEKNDVNILIHNIGNNKYLINSTNVGKLNVELIDLNSKKVFNQSTDNLVKDQGVFVDFNSYSHGIYLLQLYSETKPLATQKIILE